MELKDEAQALTKYLIGENATKEVVDLYTLALGRIDITLSRKELKRWDKMIKNAFLLKVIDSGLAILEAQPNYCTHFFQKKRKSWYLLNFFYRGVVSVFYLMIGVLYLKLFKI